MRWLSFFDDNLDDIGLHVKSFLFCHNTRRSPSFLERQWSVLESSMGGITSGWHANENHGRIQGLAASGSTPCFIGAMRCWKADCIRLYGSTSRRSRRNHLRSIQPARFGQELFEIAINSTLRGRIQKTPWRVLFLQLLGPMIFFCVRTCVLDEGLRGSFLFLSNTPPKSNMELHAIPEVC